MKCISVYTKDFALFSDIYEQIMEAPPEENEEIILKGMVIGAGDVPNQYTRTYASETGISGYERKRA